MLRRPPPLILLLALLLFLFLQLYWLAPSFSSPSTSDRPYPVTSTGSSPLPGLVQLEPAAFNDPTACPSFPGIQDVLVILKTDATVIRHRLPTHFNTTLKCIPNYVIYSSLEEEIDRHRVYDALDEYDMTLKTTNPDFALYRRIHTQGRPALTDDEANGTSTSIARLDRWKMLPMVDKALRQKPDAKWFVFVEDETFILWSTMVQWLAKFDPTQRYYFGAQAQDEEVAYATGGAGIVLSNPAMRAVSQHRANNQADYDGATVTKDTGDMVLGVILRDIGIPLQPRSRPILHDQHPFEIVVAARAYKKMLWCYPVASFHVASNEIDRLWRAEQDAMRTPNTSTVRHGDVFRRFVLPQLPFHRDDWDNLSRRRPIVREPDGKHLGRRFIFSSKKARAKLQDVFAATSYDACKSVCEGLKDCVQFSFSPGQCHTSKYVTVGHRNATFPGRIRSGWILDRIEEFSETAPSCDPISTYWLT